jgi:hypothetical protein
MRFAPAPHEEDPRKTGVFRDVAAAVALEAVGKHRNLNACAKTAVQHRSEGLEGGIEAAATAVGAESAEHAAQHHSDAQARAEAAAAEEALIAAESAKAALATAELARESAKAWEGSEAAAGTAKSATILHSLLEAGLIGILGAKAASGLLEARLITGLIGILARHNAAVLAKALLETSLEGILAGEATHSHHLLHLGQLLLHLAELLLHHARLKARLERILLAELAGEALAAAGLLHGEVVELLSLLATALLLFAEKFAE